MENPESRDHLALTEPAARTRAVTKVPQVQLDNLVPKVPTEIQLQQVPVVQANQDHLVHQVRQVQRARMANRVPQEVQENLERTPSTALARKEPPLQPLWLKNIFLFFRVLVSIQICVYNWSLH